jgi:H+/Cl- antiporter ClcA
MPIVGAIFGVEVLFVGSVLYDVLLPSFIAGVTAYQVSAALGITYFNHPVPFVPVFSEGFFITVAVAGLFFGICSFVMVETVTLGKRGAEAVSLSPPLKALVGGSKRAGLTFLTGPRFPGLGLDTIKSPSIRVEIGKQMDRVDAGLHPDGERRAVRALRVLRSIWKKPANH